MGRLEDKLKQEGVGFLRCLEAVVRVRMLRLAIEGSTFDVEDIKRRIDGEESLSRAEMMKISSELMLFEHEAFRKAKKLLRRYKHGVQESSA